MTEKCLLQHLHSVQNQLFTVLPARRSLKATGLGMQALSWAESTVPTSVYVRWRMLLLIILPLERNNIPNI